MFWENINNNLFKPLASPNSKVYSVALFALYEQLVTNQVEVGECTPADTKATIRRTLLEYDQHINWAVEEDVEKLFSDEPDEAGRIYRRLRDCGWLREIDGVGYRRETFMPRVAASLISALDGISKGPVSRLGSTCQGIYGAIRSVRPNPAHGAINIEFAANCARTFFAELSAMAASCQEVAYLLKEEHTSNKLFETFFEDFLQGILLTDYSKLNLTSHPYRYRAVTIEEIFAIFDSPETLSQMSEKHHKENETESVAASLALIEKDLNDINKVFEGIDILLKRIEHYRSTMTRRAREAMQYALAAVPELGKRLDLLVENISVQPDNDIKLPSLQISENYVGVERFYRPKVKPLPPEATSVDKKQPSIEVIAQNRAADAYIRRRAPSPKRIMKLLERALGDNQSTTTDTIVINDLDDFIAYLQMRDLLHDAVPPSSPYAPLIKLYRLSPVPGEFTENDYLIAPKIYIERRIHPKLLRKNNAA